MNYPLSDRDILKAVKNQTNIILYSELKNIRHINDILKNDSCVILYEQMPGSGHWVVLTYNKNNNELEYFNSYGDYPDEFLHLVDENLKKKLNEDYPYLSRLLLDSGYKLTYNDKQLQKLDNNIATCGRYVVLRILLKELPLKQFINIFNNRNYTPDQIAKKLTYKLF